MSITAPSVKFAPRGKFAKDLDAAVNAYFDEADANGEPLRRRRDLPRMYLKSAIILTWFVSSWVFLVFVADHAWMGILGAVSIGLAIAAVGMSVMHDANHGAYSDKHWVNRVFGATLDVMGVASLIWRPKHNMGHHTYTNVEGVDYDLDFGGLAILSPQQSRRPWHRYQQFYLWFFYGFLHPKWVFHDDWVIMKKRHIGVYKLPPASKLGLVWFLAVKAFFVTWAIIIPALYHPIWQVVVFHFIAAFTLGTTLGTFFQLAHCTVDAEFPEADAKNALSRCWASHQLATTVNFGPNSRLLTWFCGGLNFQVEHHLFPKVCHLHYPALSPIVARVVAEHGLRYRSQATFAGALVAHFQHLRAMGIEPLPQADPEPAPAE